MRLSSGTIQQRKPWRPSFCASGLVGWTINGASKMGWSRSRDMSRLKTEDSMNIFWLVVEPYPSEKYEFVSWDYKIPNIWKIKHVPNHQPVFEMMELPENNASQPATNHSGTLFPASNILFDLHSRVY